MPKMAREGDYPATVLMLCSIQADGVLDCKVTQEDPPHRGFGEAAKRIARYYRANPQTLSGAETSGASFKWERVFELQR
jgi:hypothetical protein